MKDFEDELQKLKDKNLLRKPACIESKKDSKIVISGKTYINFSSNDYLNLSAHPDIVKAAVRALREYGFGSGSSRLLSGTYLPHKRLEAQLAKFKKTDAALVFNTGYAANTGIIPALAGDDAMIFSDELNHASIIDGIRLSKAEALVYAHGDMGHLERLLKKSFGRKSIKRRMIITDTVFSMDGDMAPLNDLVYLSNKYDTLLMTDDAHGAGVLGEKGRGALEHFGIRTTDRIIQMGTLSKACGCFGAFVAGSNELINLLTNKSRSFIYSTSLPPAVAEACTAAIDIVENRSEQRRKKLWKNRRRLFNGLHMLGFDTLNSETQIIPVLIGNTEKAVRAGEYLFRRMIYAPAIRPPTVPEGKSRLRFSVMSGHSNDDIDYVLNALEKLNKR